MGTAGIVIMTITAVAAIMTGIIGGYRATTRILSTIAEDRILSEKFSKTTYRILFIMVISIVLAFLGRNTLNWFVDLTSFGAIVGFGYTSASAWKIARTENNKKRVVLGIIGTVISVLFGIVQLVPRLTAMEAMGSEAFLMLALWCLVGFIFYWRTARSSTLTEFSGISTAGIVLFVLLIYASLMWLGKLLMAGRDAEEMKASLVWGGIVLLVIIFAGMTVMLYLQNYVRKKHEAAEREKIRAVEGNLAKSQFLFNMSHDIRTPMNAIIGYTNLALKEPASQELHEYLEKIDLSSHHLLALINDILEMSRIENGKIELDYVPTDLCVVFEGIRELFDEQMKQKQMDFSVHTSQVKNRYVWCDRKNLNRVLLNILGNAYKFTPPGGTTMVIRLKFRLAEEEDIQDAPQPDAQEETVDFSGKRLLLVEDNMINMEIADMILTQMGFVVETAENGQAAVDMVSASGPGYYDLVLMDIQMPVMDGYAATRAIRAMDNSEIAGMPIIAMTANAFAEDINAAEEAGMDGHIAKPIDIQIMIKTITEALGKRTV